MRILIISDTHGNTRYIDELIRKFKDEIQLLIHLGDDSSDIDYLEGKGINILKVPGLFEKSYNNPETKRRFYTDIRGKKLLLSHTRHKHTTDFVSEPGPEELSVEADIILYGHTHAPEIKIDENRKIWINPGHLKENDNRGHRASYVILEFAESGAHISINVTIFDFSTGTIIDFLEIK